MCCDADWKREIVPDHKFDFINVREFRKTDLWTRIKYIIRYALFFKSLTVYGLDIFIAVTMISSDHWTTTIAQHCGDDCAVPVRFDIAKWIFVGCIIFSFLLLGYETWKAKNVVESRDISYAFTNLIANDYYSFKNYDNFCLFCHIDSSTKRKDDFAFWIFFTFKGWKRLLLADGPRQSINALVLYSFAYSYGFQTHDIPAYWDRSPITAMLLFAMIGVVLLFAGSLILLIAAALLYVPLLCYIQGNLKEYVCHKVDKRIAELIKKKQKQRVQRQVALEKQMAGSGGSGSGKAGSFKDDTLSRPMPQPTLPKVDLDDDRDDDQMWRAKHKADRAGISVPVVRREPSPVQALDPSGLYPGPPPLGSQPPVSYNNNGYPPRLDYDQPYSQGSFGYGDDYGSSMNLTAHAAPPGISYPPHARPNFPPSHSSRDILLRPTYTQSPSPGPAYGRGGYDDPPSSLPYDEPSSGGYFDRDRARHAGHGAQWNHNQNQRGYF